MGIIDRLFVGKVKDFGLLEQRSFGIGKSRKGVLLVEKRGELYLALRSSAWTLFGGSVRYDTFELANAYKLREFIDESERIVASLPPSTYDPRVEANRRSLLTAAIGSAVLLLVRGMNSMIVAALILLWVYAGQMWMLWRYQGIRSFIVRRCALLLLFICVIVGTKVVLLS